MVLRALLREQWGSAIWKDKGQTRAGCLLRVREAIGRGAIKDARPAGTIDRRLDNLVPLMIGARALCG